MQTKWFKNGKVTPSFTYKTYIRPAGHGWEVCLEAKGHPIFVGNFVHKPEATKWFNVMKKEIIRFSKKYPVGPKLPIKWFQGFLSCYLYETYYKFLNGVFEAFRRQSPFRHASFIVL